VLLNTQADFYHVRCLEELVDFSAKAYLECVIPIIRHTVKLRNVNILDGNYLLDGGAERLVLEWKASMGRLRCRRDGEPNEPLDPEFDDFLRKSGSASYTPKQLDDMTFFEYFNLSEKLAPIESDGIEDHEEWNLFHEYLPSKFEDLDDLKEPHSLSKMLSHWERDKVRGLMQSLAIEIPAKMLTISLQFLARTDESKLSDKGKEAKKKLSEKSIRAIRRLSSIIRPDFQSILMERRT
jgi:hypothetical protein